MTLRDKPLAWLHGEIKTPPLGKEARIDKDAIVIFEVFAKKTGQTPAAVIATCRKRLKEYDGAGR